MIQAAGAVLWRQGRSAREVAVVHRPRYDDWSLPKGKLEQGEPHVLAAVREVLEETGMTGTVGASLGSTRYDVDGRPKTVRWWSLHVDPGEFVANDEVDELRWLAVGAAMSIVRDDDVLGRWAALPDDVATVLLVRHGSAGDPSRWDRADDDRPLDAKGRAQAQHVARVLAAFRPARILSAPPLRCRETIAPLALAAGLPVRMDALVGESGAPARPERHVLELALPGQAVVVCSQGGVIPRVVDALAPDRAPAAARKGSVWGLSLSVGQCVAVDDAVLT